MTDIMAGSAPQIIKDFAAFAETCFENYGDRVKHWITFNEPHTVAIQGYDVGLHAPGRCSIFLHLFCHDGNSATEPYIVAHNMLLSHGTVADIYRKKYKAKQQGSLGISLDVIWFEPATNTTDDIEATQRAQDFQLGWFIEPLILGNYPISMRNRVGDRLPNFTKNDVALVKGSLDFVGINHYTTFYAQNNGFLLRDLIGKVLHDSLSDSGTLTLPFGENLKPIGDRVCTSLNLNISIHHLDHITMSYECKNYMCIHLEERHARGCNAKLETFECSLFLIPFFFLQTSFAGSQFVQFIFGYIQIHSPSFL
ncbi:hypothetical protein OIU84_019456 [Salix udensis]|uniref:Uncharacterized protein n=1 Tax=Salix udensis TaxID=889485 RepID=A0AAD6KYX9_9ROSI|nr:hypothetical protein OIU84_019456 [Salix udensis]